VSNYQIFEGALKAVEKGWIKGDLRDENGVCLVGGLMQGQGVSYRHDVDRRVLNELDAELRKRHLGYRVMAFFDDHRGYEPAPRIEAWNDMPWRRKKTVVKVLRALADSQRTEWLQDERSRLLIKITQLESLVHTLQERVGRLERENEHLWNRVRNVRQLQTDMKSLEYLESELAEVQHQLETVG
jgi:hypothetical protein